MNATQRQDSRLNLYHSRHTEKELYMVTNNLKKLEH